MPTQKKGSIKPRLNYRHETKSGYQLLLEIRNITDKDIRISALSPRKKIIHIKRNQIEKGKIINHPKENILNNHLENLCNKTRIVIPFLNAIKVPVSKKSIEEYLYDASKLHDAKNFYEYVEDEESAKVFFTEYDKTEEQKIQEEKTLKQKDFNSGIYKPQCLIEILEMHQPARINRRLASILKFYCKSIGHQDIHYSNFSKDLIYKIVKHCIEVGYEDGKNIKRYKFFTVKDMIVKMLKKYGKYLHEELGLAINPDYKNFRLTIGKHDSLIKYNWDSKKNVFTLYHSEFKQIETADFSHIQNNELKNLYEKTRINFIAQTYSGGLRISDYKELNKDSFITLNGQLTLSFYNNKTRKTLELPVSQKLKSLLEEYKYELPIFKTDQNYNESLKLMANIIGLNRDILLYEDYAHYNRPKPIVKKLHELFTNKLARKALASILFNNGETVERIATITGHSTDEIHQYIRLEENYKLDMLNKI